MSYYGMAGGPSMRDGHLNLKYMPDPKNEYAVNYMALAGGLNVFDLPYNLNTSESPDMKNLYWRDGALDCRLGQTYLIDRQEDYGPGLAAYPYTFWDYAFVHLGTGIYCYRVSDLKPTLTRIYNGLAATRGTFFRYQDFLFYKNRGAYIKISFNALGVTPSTMFAAQAVEGYVPITYINMDPTTHAADSYQPENRLSPTQTVWFNASANIAIYHLPVQNLTSVDKVIVDGVVLTAGTDYTVDLTAGTVTFTTAPPVHDPLENNTVRITYTLDDANYQEKFHSIMDCPYATVYGGDVNLCVVLGGCPAQPNAYFWNANNIVMDPSYFPFPHYNFAGDTENMITGFGKQQSDLIIFSERSVGKASMSTTTLNTGESNERIYLQLPYTAINSMIGCDLPWSIQLIENNLVFCNTDMGVHILQSSSAAYENNIVSLSKKVNGNTTRPYLLNDVRRQKRQTGVTITEEDTTEVSFGDTTATGFYSIEQVLLGGAATDDYTVDADNGKIIFPEVIDVGTVVEVWYLISQAQMVCSLDTGFSYWLCANGHVYVWDYEISTYKNPSWFFWSGIDARAFLREEDKYYHVGADGKVVKFERNFTDFDKAIEKVYEFARTNMGTYNNLKDVKTAIFVVRSDTDTAMDITYITDYEERKDLTPILSYTYRLSPRDLSYRYLGVHDFAQVFKRRPGCRHVRHFGMRLSNNAVGQDMSIMSAQIFYTLQGRER